MTMTAAAATDLTAKMFKGFADPTRIAILVQLLDGEQRVSDLVDAVGGSQSNVSGHLACLKECELVTDRPGPRRQVFYRLSGDEVVDLLRAAERLLSTKGHAIELCGNPMMDDGCCDG